MNAQSHTTIRNPFRRPDMRQAFAAAVRMFQTKHKNFFLVDGVTAHRQNSWAGLFWAGYSGHTVYRWDAAGRRTPAYATWKAGAVLSKGGPA